LLQPRQSTGLDGVRRGRFQGSEGARLLLVLRQRRPAQTHQGRRQRQANQPQFHLHRVKSSPLGGQVIPVQPPSHPTPAGPNGTAATVGQRYWLSPLASLLATS